MAKRKPAPPKLPPPTEAQCWRVFALWVLGVPLLVGAALGFVWFAVWATGSLGMSWQLESNSATVLLSLAAIVLFYPALLWVWWSELQDGLRQARAWQAMSPEAQAAAIALAEAAGPKRRSRKQE
jgi:hypothetical protein